MRQDGTPVKPFTYGSPDVVRAKVLYLLAIKGLKQENLHRLLAFNPTQSMLSRVCNARKRSAPLESRIATVLGVSREELFGAGPLNLWRAA
jgi:hypothetical protein